MRNCQEKKNNYINNSQLSMQQKHENRSQSEFGLAKKNIFFEIREISICGGGMDIFCFQK